MTCPQGCQKLKTICEVCKITVCTKEFNVDGHLLRLAPRAPEWLPYPENKPKKRGWYLLTYRILKDGKLSDPYVDKGYYTNHWDSVTCLVTAYMPLPEPYGKS